MDSGWRVCASRENPAFHTKINRCWTKLVQWSKSRFSNNRIKIAHLPKQIESVQREINTAYASVEERALKQELAEYRRREDTWWSQRAIIRWLGEGIEIIPSSTNLLWIGEIETQSKEYRGLMGPWQSHKIKLARNAKRISKTCSSQRVRWIHTAF